MGIERKLEKRLKEIYKVLNRGRMRRYDNGVKAESNFGILDFVVPKGVPNASVYIGYIQHADGSIPLEDMELEPINTDRALMALVADLEPYDVEYLLLDGTEATVIGHTFVYSFPFVSKSIREWGKGQKLCLRGRTAAALAMLVAAAHENRLPLTIGVGSEDSENFVIDVAAKHDLGLLHMRLEQPILFAPWTDFDELITTLMGQVSVVVQPRLRSLRAALNKAIEKSREADKERGNAMFELLLEEGSLNVRALQREGYEDKYNDDELPIPVKIDGYSGASAPRYQFALAGLLHEATEIFGKSESGIMAVGELIGDPIVLWTDDARFAIRTAERV